MPIKNCVPIELGVKIISTLPLTWGIGENIELIAILLGKKPATILYEKDENETDKKRIGEILDALAKVGLLSRTTRTSFYEPGGWIQNGVYHPSGRGYRRSHIVVALTKENLERMASAKTDEELGIAYGFPETAIMAYIGKKGYTRYDMPRSVEHNGPDYYSFISFVLSKEHWREEVERAREEFEAVREVAPDIVRKWVEAWRGPSRRKGKELTPEQKMAIARYEVEHFAPA